MLNALWHFTCFAYIYQDARGIANTRRNANDSVIILGYGLLACVGFGLIAYHSSIKYSGQMVDKISMLYATATIPYGALSVTLGRTSRRVLAFFLSGVVVSFSITYCFTGDIKAFQIYFLVLILMVSFRCGWLLLTSNFERKSNEEMTNLAGYGTVTFLTGFMVWNMDNICCAKLRSLRSVVGMPVGLVTELHGWWHVLTALRVYYYVVLIEYLRLYMRRTNAAAMSEIAVNLI